MGFISSYLDSQAQGCFFKRKYSPPQMSQVCQVFPPDLHQQQVSQAILHKYCLPAQVEKVAPCAKKERFMLISEYAGHKANMENLGKQFSSRLEKISTLRIFDGL